MTSTLSSARALAWVVVAVTACGDRSAAPPRVRDADAARPDAAAAGPTSARERFLQMIRADLAAQVLAIETLVCPPGDLLALGRFDCEVTFTGYAHRYVWTRGRGAWRAGTWTGEAQRFTEPATVQLSADDALARFTRLSFGPVALVALAPDALDGIARTLESFDVSHDMAFDRIECPELLAAVPSLCLGRRRDDVMHLEVRVQSREQTGSVLVGRRTPRPAVGCGRDLADARDPGWCRATEFPAVLTWMKK